MTARVLPFHRTAEAAWDYFQALNREAEANPHLLDDPEHFARRTAAHEHFAVLFRRECRVGAKNEGWAA